MLAFTVPVLAWAVGFVLTSGRTWAAVGVFSVVVLLAAREPVGIAMDVPDSPWAAPENVLRRANLLQMLDLLDPKGAPSPRLWVMDLQTYYLLLPLYFTERRAGRHGPEDTFFYFRYGKRDVVVLQSWVLTAGGAQEETDLRSLADRVDRSDPLLGLASARRVQVLVGGWRSVVVDQLLALEDSGVVTSHRLVPGLFAFLVDMERLNAQEGSPEIH